jgi:hypothetical protein
MKREDYGMGFNPIFYDRRCVNDHVSHKLIRILISWFIGNKRRE